MLKKFLNIFCSALVLAGLSACEKSGSATQKTHEPKLVSLTGSEINGTKLATGIDLAGVITDAATGKGIPGVAVTDGYQYVKTDANGVYQMKRNSMARKVYYTIPAAYQVPLDNSDHLPMFFSPGMMSKGLAYRCDFVLNKLSAPETDFTLIAIGDPQCQNISESSRFLGETIPDIKRTMSAGNYPAVYAVTLGDVTFDSFYMFDPMVRCMRNIMVQDSYLPFFNCVGNHDHNSLVKAVGNQVQDDYNATEEHVKHFGPVDYSFDRGNAHIIVMDNVAVTNISSSRSPNSSTWNYTNKLLPSQLEWLKQDIAMVENPESKLVIFCAHQPIRGAASTTYSEVVDLLSKFNEIHFFIGHTHYQQNYIHEIGGKQIFEHIHGAACGGWWTANSSVTGAPNGYSVYNVRGNKIKDWFMKGTNRDENYQMRIYDGNQEYGSEVTPNSPKIKVNWYSTTTVGKFKVIGNANFKNAFVAEVFDDDNQYWSLEFWQNGQKVGDFVRAAESGINNAPICAFWYNDKGRTTDTWCNRTASHYWYYKPASGKPAEEKNWEVRAVHKYPNGGSVTYKTSKLTTDYSEF